MKNHKLISLAAWKITFYQRTESPTLLYGRTDRQTNLFVKKMLICTLEESFPT